MKKVKILGFKNYASYSLATKMANSEDDVINFWKSWEINKKKKAIKELEEIKQIAKEDGVDDFRASDISFIVKN